MKIYSCYDRVVISDCLQSFRKDLFQKFFLLFVMEGLRTHSRRSRGITTVIFNILLQKLLQARIDKVPNAKVFVFFLDKAILRILIVFNGFLDSFMRERSQLFYSNDSNVLHKSSFTSLFPSFLFARQVPLLLAVSYQRGD